MIYTYECSRCGRFEITRPMNAPRLEHCQMCGEKGVEIVLFPPLIQFNGGGWASEGYVKK
jgi:putative FmdB family regulatory protein